MGGNGITFNDCSSGTAKLEGSDGTVTHNMVKLTNIVGLYCQESAPATTNAGVAAVSTDIIETHIPTSLGRLYTNHFNRYVKYTAPNGKPIHLVAQHNITDEQLLRAIVFCRFS